MAMNPDKIATELAKLDGWKHEDDCLKKTFRFGDFRQAFAFMVRVAFIAEELNHHPRFDNTYNTVALTLNTHDAGNTVTEKDLTLAARIQEL
jgi:4a-hydroxytetrahydrobiopterin dehydratase